MKSSKSVLPTIKDQFNQKIYKYLVKFHLLSETFKSENLK